MLYRLYRGLENNIEVIYNYVNTEKFKPPEKLKGLGDDLRVLYPRRLTLLRGCNEFIRASVECPDYDFLAVGQGADQQAINNNKHGERQPRTFALLGAQMEGMEELYQEADLAVVPTKACEGLALSLLESMVCLGLPTITTIHGGLTDSPLMVITP